MHQQKQKLQNMHQSSLFYQFLKRLIQFSISFSVFSFLLLHPAWPPFFHTFISYLSTFSSQLFSLATDKNYIFLLCNGILVFIAKYSSYTVDTCPQALPETSPDNDLYYRAYSQSMQSSIEKSLLVEDATTIKVENENGSEGNKVMTEEDVEEKHVVYQITDGTLWEEEEEKGDDDDEEEDVINDDDDKVYKENSDSPSSEEQEEDNYEYYDEEGDEAEQEEAIAKMSTEELNRKFDDFIRKMKEELRVEAQRQLIVV